MQNRKIKQQVCLAAIMLGAFCGLKAHAEVPTFKYPDLKAEESVVFSEGTKPFYLGHVGSSENWMVPMWESSVTTQDGKKATAQLIQNQKPDDTIQIEWRGREAHFIWLAKEPRSYQALSDDNGAVTMIIRVDKKPKKKVQLKMDCGYPCVGPMDVTKLFKSLPEGQWMRLSFRLECFANAGADLNKIYSPLIISANGKFKASLADLRVVKNAPSESLVKC